MDLRETLTQAVQKNCDLVDADHAQDYGPCIYLLRMRDHYRWRHKLPMHSELDNQKVKHWILDTEEYWDGIEGESFVDIPVNGAQLDPFEVKEINELLREKGLVYLGGLGYGCVPVFNLATIEEVRENQGFTIIISDTELARGIFGHAAMCKDQVIHVRKAALKQLLWGRYEDWLFSKHDNITKKAFGFYDFNQLPEQSLEEMTKIEIDTLIYHEIGEGLLEQEFGSAWKDMLSDFPHTKTELMLRAVRDLAADCLSTLPFLVEKQRLPSLYFYFSTFSDIRGTLFPDLKSEFLKAEASGDFTSFKNLVSQGKSVWFDVGHQVLELYQSEGKEAQVKIDALLEHVQTQ